MNLVELYKQSNKDLHVQLNNYLNFVNTYKGTTTLFYTKQQEYFNEINSLRIISSKIYDNMEIDILKNNLYLPYSALKSLTGNITYITVVLRYGEGYEKLESIQFNGCYLNKGEIFDKRGKDYYWNRINNNVYQQLDSRSNKELLSVEILGFFDLYLDDKLIQNTSLEYLYNNKQE